MANRMMTPAVLQAKQFLPVTEKIDRTEGETRFRGTLFSPEGTSSTRALVLIPGLSGADGPMLAEAKAIAAAGTPAFVIDLYGGKLPADRGESIRMFSALDRPAALKAIAAARHWLSGSPAKPVKTGLAGYALGADLAVASAAATPPAMLALYYGGAADAKAASALKCPVIGFFSRKDGFLTSERVDAFKAAIPDSGVPPQVYFYDADPGFQTAAVSPSDKSYAQTARERTLQLLTSR